MNDDLPDKMILERIRSLAEERKEIISLPPEKVVDRILNASQPAALVHSFPEEDFYLLIQDIGSQGSLPILSLASDKQWEYLLDMDLWDKDRINIKTLTTWLDLLSRADPKRCINWMVDRKTDILEYYLFKNIEVKLREHDQDPSEFGDDFFTHDNIYYVRLRGHPLADAHGAGEAVEILEKQYQEFLAKLIAGLADFDHITYQKILLEAANVIPAETEEEAYRRRNVRLAEKGFLPFEEAIRIYHPLKPADLKTQVSKSYQTKSSPHLLTSVPQHSTRMLEEDNLFARALNQISVDQDIEHLQIEFASLCNQIIAADQRPIPDRNALKEVVKKASGYVSIGLERLTGESEKSQIHKKKYSAAFIRQYLLADLFRVGYGQALGLKWRAEKWLANCWFAGQGLPLTFWGEAWLGVLGGLLIKRPLFFDNYRSGKIYREFFSRDDITETETSLNDIVAFDDLLSLMSINLAPLSSYGFLIFKNLILTLWARHVCGLSEDPHPLTLNQFKGFFDQLGPAETKPKKISQAMKESFLNWLCARTTLKDYEIAEKLGHVFENLFKEIESEYGAVSTDDLDPRYIHLFLLEKNH
jgi:hypothetical protein